MTEATPKAQPFKYSKPEGIKGRKSIRLARTDRMVANIIVVKEGGENNLHAHRHLDGFWMVLKGRVRFYGVGDEIIGEYGALEGVLVPRNFAYWFESCGEEDLEMLQLESFDIAIPVHDDQTMRADRVNFEPLKTNQYWSGRPGGSST